MKLTNQIQRQQPGLIIKTSLLFVLAMVVLGLFQSSALLSLSYDLTPNSQTEIVVRLAEQWHHWMQALGTAGVTDLISEAIEIAYDKTIVN